MLRRARLPIALLTLAVVLVACTDRPAPTAPLSVFRSDANAQTGTCTTIDDLTALVNQVFGAGSPNASSALGKLSNVDKKLRRNDVVGAQDAARNLIRFVQEKAASLPGEEYVPQLIASLECYVGITDDTFLVFPADEPQVLVTDNGTAGISLPAQPVSEPTLITIAILPDTTTGLLDTKLDKYPGFIRITQLSGVANSLVDSVVVGVCPAASVPANVLNRLRLGHQASAGFEVTPAADASFLDCTGAVASASSDKLPSWVRSLAGLVLPKTLYAQMEFGGGVGGTVTEFSPFGPVDPELSFGGGVGGTVTEFIRVPAPTPAGPRTPSATKPREIATKSALGAPVIMAPAGTSASLVGPEACLQGVVGTALPAECRPRVTITTANGTILQNVPVSFGIGLGSGTTAIDDPTTRSCGSFGGTASTTTNANGKAGACWMLGAEAGTNTLIATASAGGDAPEGVYFTPSDRTFSVTALRATASLSLSGLNQTYTGSPLAVTVTSTPLGLSTVNVTYNGSATAPTEAGSYALVATLVNPSFEATATGTFVIGQAAQSALVATGPGAATFGGAPVQLTTTGGSGSGAVTFSVGNSTACSVTSDGLLSITSGTGTCSVTATKAADSNHESVTSAPISVSPVKATASIALSDLAYTYDATAKSATASTTPANLPGVSITHDGATTLPVNAGSYAVLATLSNADYAAADASGTLVIARAGQAAFALAAPATATFGAGAVQLSAGGGSGTGAVTFASLSAAACSVDATTGVTSVLTGIGNCIVSATKAGDANYEAITAASVSIALNRASQSIDFVTLPARTYGDAAFTVNATASSSLPVTFSAVAGSNCAVTGSTVSLTGAGSCAVLATQAGDAELFMAAAPVSQSFSIAKKTATATAGSGSVTVGGTVSLPCSVSGLLSGDAGTVSCTTALPSTTTGGSFPTTPIVSPTNPANYAVIAVNGTLSVRYVQQDCFAEPIKSLTIPPTTSGITKGATVQVRCTLLNASGSAVLSARGDLVVQDYTTGVQVLAVTDAFRLSSGTYGYKLSTSASGFVKGNFYRITATWNDGSTTVGWFYLNK